MNGARMRSYSLSGTRPENTSRSVPRLSALAQRAHAHLARRRRRDAVSARISALPGATYQSACACSDRLPATCIRIGLCNPPPAISCCGNTRTSSTPTASRRDSASHRRAVRRAGRSADAPAPLFFALVVLASMVGLIWLLAFALSAGGFGVVDFILVVLFAITLPWSVIGFWNATIGLFIMRFAPTRSRP